MDATWVATLSGLLGAALGAAAAYLGPLQIERRKERREQTAKQENQATVDLERYIRVRAVVDVWLDLLRRAYEDVLHQRLELGAFEAGCTRHAEELRLRMAELAYINVVTLRTVGLVAELRDASAIVGRIDLLPFDEKRRVVHEIGAAIERCRETRDQWSVGLLEHIGRRGSGTWTVFDDGPDSRLTTRPFPAPE